MAGERRASKERLAAERKRTGKKFSRTPPKKVRRGKSSTTKTPSVTVRSKPGSARTVLRGDTTRARVKRAGGG